MLLWFLGRGLMRRLASWFGVVYCVDLWVGWVLVTVDVVLSSLFDWCCVVFIASLVGRGLLAAFYSFT